MFNILMQAPESDPKTISFDKDEITIGRLSTSDIPVKATNVSKQHSRIVKREGRFFIIDRKSTNGTFVNGQRVNAPQPLQNGDNIFVGDFSLTFLLPESEAKPKTSTPPPIPDAQGPPALPADAAPATPPSLDEVAEMVMEEDKEASAQELEQVEKVALKRLELYQSAFELEEFENEEVFFDYLLDDEAVVKNIASKLKPIVDKVLTEDFSEENKTGILETLVKELLGYGPLEELLHDDNIEEIFVNGPYSIIAIKNGKKEIIESSFSCDESLFNVLARLIAPAGVMMDEDTNMIDILVPDGYTVTGIFYPNSLVGTSLRIVKPFTKDYNLSNLIENSTLTKNQAGYLKNAILNNKTICLCAANDRDQSLLLNALIKAIPSDDRIAVLNPGAMLASNHMDQILLEGDNGEVDESYSFGIEDLLHNIDKMGIDRVVYRGVREESAAELLYAINGGLTGSVFSLFGSSAADCTSRLERMALYASAEPGINIVKQLVAGSVNVVLSAAKDKNNNLKVGEICEVNPTGDSYSLKPIK